MLQDILKPATIMVVSVTASTTQGYVLYSCINSNFQPFMACSEMCKCAVPVTAKNYHDGKGQILPRVQMDKTVSDPLYKPRDKLI